MAGSLGVARLAGHAKAGRPFKRAGSGPSKKVKPYVLEVAAVSGKHLQFGVTVGAAHLQLVSRCKVSARYKVLSGVWRSIVALICSG